MTHKKQIVLDFYSCHNLGDDLSAASQNFQSGLPSGTAENGTYSGACAPETAGACDAFVKIGGSIFMQHAPGCTEIDFSTEKKPDLSFPGKSAVLEELPSVTLEDVLYNYQNNIIADCTDHYRYAVNQFSGLESYLNEKESAIESSIV